MSSQYVVNHIISQSVLIDFIFVWVQEMSESRREDGSSVNHHLYTQGPS